MEEKQTKCNSCNSTLTNQKGSTIFSCPKCAEQQIARCFHCRKISSKYTCPSCGFMGPN